MKSLPIDYVFIDTSVFQQSSFFKKEGQVDKLCDFAEQGYIKIIMPEITEKEWKKHFFDDSRYNVQDIERKSLSLGLEDSDVFIGKHKDLLKMYEQMLKEAFQNHLKRAKIVRLPMDYFGDQVKNVFDKYFKNEKPFGVKGKKDEFPDAFVLASLEKYAKENGLDKIIVLSNDNDMKEYEGPNLSHQDVKQYLEDLVKTTIPEIKKQRKLEKLDCDRLFLFIDSNPPELLSQIREKVEEYISEESHYEERFNFADVEEAYVEDCKLDSSVKDMDILSVEDEIITAVFYVDVDARIMVRHFNEEASIWDSEEKEYFEKVYSTTVVNLSSFVNVTIDYSRLHKDEFELVSIGFHSLQDAINKDPMDLIED
jgi:hypothetical protein